jgi:small-conductance mechanosensitive channel
VKNPRGFALRAINRELGDYAVTIRAKMMTVPGEQFVIRCKAYAMIKKAFDENGIKIRLPDRASRRRNVGYLRHRRSRATRPELTHPAAAQPSGTTHMLPLAALLIAPSERSA